MRRFLLRLLINALGLYAAVILVPQVTPGITWDGSWLTLVVMALILAVVNALVRPLLSILTCPLIILTLGLFTLVINALILWLAGLLGQALGLGFRIQGFVPAFLGALIVSIVNVLATLLLGDEIRHRRR